MLSKSRRLKTADFKGLRKARTVHAPHLFLRVSTVTAPKGLPPPTGKAAVIVSASAYKKAVDRNLLRRRVYSILRRHMTLFGGTLIAVTLKKGALAIPFAELEQELASTLRGFFGAQT